MTVEERAEKFKTAYQALCQEHGVEIQAFLSSKAYGNNAAMIEAVIVIIPVENWIPPKEKGGD